MIRTLSDAGRLPFSLFDLHEIQTTLEDKSYWPAYCTTVALMNKILNPTIGKAPLTSLLYDVDPNEVSKSYRKIEASCDANYLLSGVAEPSLPFSLPVICQTIEMFLRLLNQWVGFRADIAAVETPPVAVEAPPLVEEGNPKPPVVDVRRSTQTTGRIPKKGKH